MFVFYPGLPHTCIGQNLVTWSKKSFLRRAYHKILLYEESKINFKVTKIDTLGSSYGSLEFTNCTPYENVKIKYHQTLL